MKNVQGFCFFLQVIIVLVLPSVLYSTELTNFFFDYSSAHETLL